MWVLHIFAPAQDLSNKALDRRQGRGARMVGGLGALHHFVRVQHFGVEREGQQRMEQSRAARAHGIFVRAEMRQRGGDELMKPRQCLGPVQRPAQCVGLRVAKAWHPCGLDGGPQDAVVVVVVPLPALGLARPVDQHAVALAHAAVEVLHEPLLAAFEHLGHFGAGGVEVPAANGLLGKGLL